MWKSELEKILRDQMPYALVSSVVGLKPVVNEEGFSEALGYVFDYVEAIRKKEYLTGFAAGVIEAKSFNELDVECASHWAEKSWLRREDV